MTVVGDIESERGGARLKRSDVATLDTADLKQELADCLSLTASSLMRAAEIWSELRRRGEEMAPLRSGLAIYLPRIARGELAAEAVVAFAGQRMLLQRLAGLDLVQQRQFAAGSPIVVAEQNERGEIFAVEKPVALLSSREVLLAFAEPGELRPAPAQIKALARQTVRPRGKRRTARTIRADTAAGVVCIGRARVDPSDLAEALIALGWSVTRKPTLEAQ